MPPPKTGQTLIFKKMNNLKEENEVEMEKKHNSFVKYFQDAGFDADLMRGYADKLVLTLFNFKEDVTNLHGNCIKYKNFMCEITNLLSAGVLISKRKYNRVFIVDGFETDKTETYFISYDDLSTRRIYSQDSADAILLRMEIDKLKLTEEQNSTLLYWSEYINDVE